MRIDKILKNSKHHYFNQSGTLFIWYSNNVQCDKVFTPYWIESKLYYSEV
jgi:hypothetical protein